MSEHTAERRGHWEVWTDLYPSDVCACSFCGTEYAGGAITLKQCPNCKAIMDEKGREAEAAENG